MSAPEGGFKHRRIGYRVEMARPFRHDEDADLIEGAYRDLNSAVIGPLILAESREGPPQRFLLIPEERAPLVHVEAALESDHRVSGYDQVVCLLYEPGEAPTRAVDSTGDRWDAGDLVAYVFDTDEDAEAARESLELASPA